MPKAIRQFVQHPETHIVAGAVILSAGVAQTHDNPRNRTLLKQHQNRTERLVSL